MYSYEHCILAPSHGRSRSAGRTTGSGRFRRAAPASDPPRPCLFLARPRANQRPWPPPVCCSHPPGRVRSALSQTLKHPQVKHAIRPEGLPTDVSQALRPPKPSPPLQALESATRRALCAHGLMPVIFASTSEPWIEGPGLNLLCVFAASQPYLRVALFTLWETWISVPGEKQGINDTGHPGRLHVLVQQTPRGEEA